MIRDESRPGLSPWFSRLTNPAHVLLDGALADPDADLEKVASVRSAPQRLSLRIIRIRSMVSWARRAGWPLGFDLRFQRSWNSRLCQRSSVSGLTMCRACRHPALKLLGEVMERFQLSARAYHRIVRVARTIADLAGSPSVDTAHLTEAIGYRALDRGSG
jgi:predicted ATPase with chaperone activity